MYDYRPTVGLVFLIVSTLLSGCSADRARACQSDEDCFVGEACVSQQCVSEDIINATGDTGSVPSDGDMGPDGQAAEDTEDPSASSCHVGAFPGACENDDDGDNESVTEAVNINSPEHFLKCAEVPAGGSERTISGRFCAGETADFFSVPVMPCEGQDMTLKVTLDVGSACEPDEYALRFWRSNGLVSDADCDAGNIVEVAGHDVRCTRGDDSVSWEIRVPSTDQLIGTFAFEVVGSPSERTTFDYELRVEAIK